VIERILVGYDGAEGQADALALAQCLALAQGSAVIDPGPARSGAIVELAHEEEPSLIAIASSDRALAGTVVPGSIGEMLLEAPARPVALAPLGFGHRGPTELRQLGVAYDGSGGSRAALSLAAGLAADAGGWLELLAVARPPVDAVRDHSSDGNGSLAHRPMTRPGLERILAEALESTDEDVSAVAEAAYGIPKRTLLRRTAALDLIAIGSRREGGPGDLLGGVAAGLVFGGARCPILVAPPVPEESPGYPSGGSRLART